MKKILMILMCALFCICLVGCGGDSNPKALSDMAKEVDLMNGANNAVIGKVSIVEVESDKVTDEALLEWKHFAEDNQGSKGKKYNYSIILFKDKDMQGVMYNGVLQTEVKFTKEKNGSYMMDNQGKIMVEKDGKLVPLE